MEITLSWWPQEGTEDPLKRAAADALQREAKILPTLGRPVPTSPGHDGRLHLYLVDADQDLGAGAAWEAVGNPLLTLFTSAHAQDELTSDLGLFLFLTRSHKLKAWTDDSNANHGVLKERELYIRTLVSYGIAKVIPLRDGDPEHRQAIARLHRIVFGQRRWYPIRRTLHWIRKEIRTLREIAAKELGPSGGLARLADPRTTQSFDNSAAFTRVLASLYQLGRRPQQEAEAAVTTSVPWLEGLGGSYQMRRRIGALLAARPTDPLPTGRDDRPENNDVGVLEAKLRCYEVLRDLADWLASGAFRWARDLADETKERRSSDHAAGLNVLVIDEILAPDVGEESDPVARVLRLDLVRKLGAVQRAFGDAVAFDYLPHPVWDNLQRYLEPPSPGQIEAVRLRFDNMHDEQPPERRTLGQYHVILVEVEFREQYIGAQIVQRLSSFFSQWAPAERRIPPSIIVLTQASNVEHVQKCLNFGADAFVRKERIYELPAQATRARILHRDAEPRGSRANFRCLYQLTPAEIAQLQSTAPESLILGRSIDVIDFERLRQLPKADLHTHIGTAIDLKTIQALALNTAGHAYGRRKDNPGLERMTTNLADHLWALVLVAGVIYRVKENAFTDVGESGRIRAAVESMWVASHRIAREPTAAADAVWGYRGPQQTSHAASAKADGKETHASPNKEPPLPETDVFDNVIERVKRAHPQFSQHEVTSFLVSIISISQAHQISTGKAVEPPESLWKYLLSVGKGPNGLPGMRPLWEDRLARAERCLISFATEGTGAPVRSVEGAPHASGLELWKETHHHVMDRVREVQTFLEGRCGEVWTRLAPVLEPASSATVAEGALAPKESLWSRVRVPALSTLVAIPPEPLPGEQSLARYLWGAGLLGADHLQYPENLILAAYSLARQAAEENILYTELRCETIGYTAAGMGAIDATDLLCVSLDLAVLHQFTHPPAMSQVARRPTPPPWTRFNVLLGAKRHKDDAKVGEIAELVAYYLQRRDSNGPALDDAAPCWWRPAAVAGFDLSGREQAKSDDHMRYIQPLFKFSAPITIHAGEQNPAEIIWEAVYRYGARRIGHGLRLRENLRLLDYCIREGICMELCPVSNRFTNAFPCVERPRSYDGRWREYYPLRYYLDRGLDVCINTDNRQLHGATSTLTHEYMAAAELAGGLTAWEVLRIVKCGFKHAFLPKHEVAQMLNAVEDRVLACVAEFL